MHRLLPLLLAAVAACAQADAADTDAARWQAAAKHVTIVRDDWGIPHVYGKKDADVVFGLMYAQAEDDFNRVETNFINSQGRLAEAEGEVEVWRDLRMKLFIDPDSMKTKYKSSPAWLRALMDAWADGLNYYLYTHPDVQPRVITKFEPWMALTFSEGSIGGDIENVSLRDLERFYGASARDTALTRPQPAPLREPTGSNGFALGPSITASHHAILWINPHTSFFFRAEAQLVSEEGLNAYGALTWGQFFVYQGFNDRAGWMHTSSTGDDMDEYAETIVRRGDGYVYRYGTEERPVRAQRIVVPYKTAAGMAKREFTVFRTHHGPIVREANGKWIAVRLMQEPVKALTQSYSRIKARNYREFKKVMGLHTNSSNNTIFADAEGNIAYFHANFIPRRDTSFDWRRPVDGSTPATEWKGLHTVDESPLVLNPPNGWVYNTNNWPYSAAGPYSPSQHSFPKYMDNGSENPRGVHALRVLSAHGAFTPQGVIDAAFDTWLPSFDVLVPSLVAAYDAPATADSLKRRVKEQIALLRAWDHRWSVTSVPTTLALFWADELLRVQPSARGASTSNDTLLANGTTAEAKLNALATASDRLVTDFGTWRTPWGNINRFQRLTGDIVQPFNDAAPSIPVGFTSSRWGALAAFGARPANGTKKYFGTSGNSFLAVVEFGDSVHARAVSAGGESGHPASRHFNDQADRYATGNLRDVYFYRAQLAGHTERQYHPGQ